MAHTDSVNPDMIPVVENKFILTKAMNRRYARVTYGRYHLKWQRITFLVSILLFAADIPKQRKLSKDLLRLFQKQIRKVNRVFSKIFSNFLYFCRLEYILYM